MSVLNAYAFRITGFFIDKNAIAKNLKALSSQKTNTTVTSLYWCDFVHLLKFCRNYVIQAINYGIR